MNIILYGPPGSGKGTQGNILVKKFNLLKVSTGDLLRDEIKKKTALGLKISSDIDKGKLISNDIINDLIEKVLSDKKYANRFIFDGYPRNLNQAKKLEMLVKKYNQKISCVISLKIEKEIILKRILGRQICSKCGLIFNEFFNVPKAEEYECKHELLKRSDDNEVSVNNRFDSYIKETNPILNYYKERRTLYEINGSKEINEINQQICDIIQSLET